MMCSRERCESDLGRGRSSTDRNLNGHPWHLNRQPQEPKMGAFWSLKLLPMGAKRHILWLHTQLRTTGHLFPINHSKAWAESHTFSVKDIVHRTYLYSFYYSYTQSGLRFPFLFALPFTILFSLSLPSVRLIIISFSIPISLSLPFAHSTIFSLS